VNPKNIVCDGYDRISRDYRGDEDEDGVYADWLAELAALIPEGGRALDLGCGNGVPVARWLTGHGFQVRGVDFSPVQIERARALVPSATFECSDMTSLDLSPASLDAVVAFYSLIHVPVEEQPPVLGRIATWLRPGGYAMLIVGNRGWTGTEEDWFGAPMYWSTADRDAYLEWLAEGGLEVLWDRFIPDNSIPDRYRPQKDDGHTLVLARSIGE